MTNEVASQAHPCIHPPSGTEYVFALVCVFNPQRLRCNPPAPPHRFMITSLQFFSNLFSFFSPLGPSGRKKPHQTWIFSKPRNRTCAVGFPFLFLNLKARLTVLVFFPFFFLFLVALCLPRPANPLRSGKILFFFIQTTSPPLPPSQSGGECSYTQTPPLLRNFPFLAVAASPRANRSPISQNDDFFFFIERPVLGKAFCSKLDLFSFSPPRTQFP